MDTKNYQVGFDLGGRLNHIAGIKAKVNLESSSDEKDLKEPGKRPVSLDYEYLLMAH